METRYVTAETFETGHVHGHRFTNLGAGFHLDVGGATQITIHRRGSKIVDGRRSPSIDWINTYGNVSANGDHYKFSRSGEIEAIRILDEIEAERNSR